MSKTKIFLVLTAVSVVAPTLYIRAMAKQVEKRFPELPPKLVKKTYFRFLLSAHALDMDLDNMTEAEIDEAFLLFYEINNPS